jgi:hypothetical protein
MTSSKKQVEEVGSELLSLIRPYYKGLHIGEEGPQFRKSLTSEETSELLCSLHEIIAGIFTETGEGEEHE